MVKRTFFSEEPVVKTLNNDFLTNVHQVSFTERACLSKPIDRTEIFQIIKTFESGKSPGSDGLTINFYKTFFHILGDDLEHIFQLAYDTGEMSESQKMSYITLICKDDNHSDNMKFYRPISLLNTDIM